METGDRTASVSGQLRPDVLIVGGGIMGLWAARFAVQAGLDVALVDGATLASGASGGLLGALMPYMPDKWDTKKQFQFEALLALEDEARLLEEETGIAVGYRRSGRLIPLPKPHLRVIAERHQKDAVTAWRAGDRQFAWGVIDRSPAGDGWPDAAVTGAGLVHDTLAARVSPRGLTAALKVGLSASSRCRIIEGAAVKAVDPDRQLAELADGRTISFGHAIITAGVGSFPLLNRFSPDDAQPLGMAVKGQAALLKADIDPDLPLIYLDGVYAVPHEGGHVAIGSTSENRWTEPSSTDEQLETLIAKARRLVPSLAEAPVVERWAGLRPKAIDRDPMVGAHPDHPRLIALTGGFKISFGLAHSLARQALRPIFGEEPVLPPGFTFAHHLQVASRPQNPA
ncbi:NAD(P)/FAD-dependent oxidoreductase [Allorhizobium taibaishanense]|uniref:D-amino-acid oxidase n=1 Tax=Allorhizobium taibaishanense TaxID=887144 RepID=A0A1Q9A490_9HYPH|nr:FAD-dependent oxidoreductase [Allorhizobium taibaishanense]MBB4006458.1 glycine oxidase [Allorhizobium taibaishanense]OLP49400.1 D-amino-acid oxidase [Allorhizobium taibaishanense]